MVVATESEVVRAAQSGYRAAFGTLYESYLPKIYDFALGMLRSKADAEDVTSETFLKAVERLGGLKEPEAFRGWLYAIARNSALSLIESRKRAVPTAEHDEYATAHGAGVLADPETGIESAELRDLVWDAAASLNPRDYQVFELTVRHGLSSAEIAEMLDVRPAYAYILVNRLKGSVEEALESVLLTRTGRQACAELDRIVVEYGEAAPTRMRKAVTRHAKSCSVCENTKRGRASVPALLAGAAFASPSAAFAAELASKIDRAWPPSAPTGGTGGGSGGSKLAHLIGIGAIVVALTGVTMGVAAQRTIAPVEEIRTRPVVEESKKSPKPEPTPTQEPAPVVDPQRTAQPTRPPARTPTIVVVDEGNEEVETPEPDDTPEPKRTLPPQKTPEPTPQRIG